MEMKSMKLSKKDAEKQTLPGKELDAPQYPWGLNLNLSDEVMEKIGMGKLPQVGSKMALMATVVVERVSENSTQSGKRQEMALQITEMCLEPHQEKKEIANKLYGE